MDPWTATLIDKRDNSWYRLNVGYYKDTEYEQLKEDVMGVAYEYINRNL